MDIQQDGAIRTLSGIFPQDRYPFPRAELTLQWAAEIDDPDVRVVVILQNGAVAGFAAATKDQLLHFGTAPRTWGSGLATTAHDEIVKSLDPAARLWVLAGNHRARRFYEKTGWKPTGRSVTDDFPPHPDLLEYQRSPAHHVAPANQHR